ncbi:hypothetical protein QTO34_011766 [Cnephaeus nilssonii]|uniref:Protein regulator of cytokinesis 1 n=1 Tax=Cnephaeus nilssonii TaxID=3371016 RepID=A0AA40HE16_CNENI|nr:hypothetical protein QTO34_011766 [Eptesicus nilssonii]
MSIASYTFRPSFTEVIAEDSTFYLQKALSHLREIWELIGIPEDQRLQRTQVVHTHIKKEERLKERLIKSIGSSQKELAVLCSELRRRADHQREGDLRTEVELRGKQKEERKRQLKLLRGQGQELCEVLCRPHYDIDSDSVPSLEELNQFRKHVATLRETKASWREEFVNIKRQIIVYMEELDHTPDQTSKEMWCVQMKMPLFVFGEYCSTTEVAAAGRQSQNEAVCEGLRAQIREPWDRLQIPQEEREAVVAVVMTGSKAKVQKALQLEVDRLEELKMQNIKKLIEATRVELAKCWDQCLYSQEQRQAFAAYCDEDYTESLLQVHDAEVVRLRHFEVHKELFEGVQKWEDSWRLFLEFELEEELKAQIEMWEQKHSTAFVVHGQKFTEYVTEQWEMHRLEKERAKQERQLKNKKQTETEMLYGSTPRTPNKRRGMTPATPGKVRKVPPNCPFLLAIL